MFCPRCGEENAENTQYCRKCGERLPDAVSAYAPAPPDLPAGPPSSGLAVTALVLACVGYATCGVLSVVGLILGIVALARAKRDPLRYSGEGLAIASIAVGAVAAIGLAVAAAVWFRMFTRGPMGFMQGKGPLARQMRVAQSEAMKSADAANLYTIGLGAAMYRKDHQGQYPSTLDAMVQGGYLDPNEFVPVQEDFAQVQEQGSGIGQYEWVGDLPARIPERTIIACTRRGVLTGGRNVLHASMAVQWHAEAELTGPPGLLAQSYAGLVKALGDDLTEERDAELKRFYEVSDHSQAP